MKGLNQVIQFIAETDLKPPLRFVGLRDLRATGLQ